MATVKLNYREFPCADPRGLPIIILHGLFGSRNNWVTTARQLARRHSIYSLDLRNHGKSPHHEKMSLRNMAEDVLQFLDDNAIAKCIMIGHSMGGKAAIQLALDHPTRIEKLVVADIVPRLYAPRHDDVFEAIDIINNTKIINRNNADKMIEHILPNPAVRLFLLTNLMRDSQGQLIWRINMKAIRDNYAAISAAPQTDINATFNAPTLFIGGTQSPYITADDEPIIKRFFPQAKIKMLDAGHWIHIDQPHAFLDLVDSFIN